MPLKRSHFTSRAVRSFFRGLLPYIFGRTGERRISGWRLHYGLRYQVLLRTKDSMQAMRRYFQARVWVDREAFPRIEKLLARATHTIVIQMFIWKDDTVGRRIAATLVQAADRGVKVHISKETVGDMFEAYKDFLSTKESKTHVWKRFWSHSNIKVTYAHHNDHSKVYIIDDEILLLSGMNIANEYDGEWHDYLVELRGRHFVEHYLTHGELPGSEGSIQIVMNRQGSMGIRPFLMSYLESARHAIVVEHSYVNDQQVLDLLIEKAKAGVLVTVIIPSKPDLHHISNMQSLGRLAAEAPPETMQIFLYPQMLHGKIILVDWVKAFLGSANLMTSSLDKMGEVNVFIEGRGHRAILKLRDVLRADILRSRPFSGLPPFFWLMRWLAWLQL